MSDEYGTLYFVPQMSETTICLRESEEQKEFLKKFLTKTNEICYIIQVAAETWLRQNEVNKSCLIFEN
ncbi:hypothetical protein GCM10008014_48010 [Paenibacillus silvae]|uniref:Uncharacterized protein n=1 Tax=Paenibacillus silvae TaxID=1325358 RepID=A0ABQ1ZHG1_9BACL|nr:hypothetical protein GCM10008014_48010 [Paenibacillus silvae]